MLRHSLFIYGLITGVVIGILIYPFIFDQIKCLCPGDMGLRRISPLSYSIKDSE